MPYHNIAANKYYKLGEIYDSEDFAEPTEEDTSRVIAKFADLGLEVEVGG